MVPVAPLIVIGLTPEATNVGAVTVPVKVGLLTTLTCNWLPVSTAVVLLPLTTLTVPLGAILVTGPPLACRFQPAPAVALIAFNCATFTASVSALPAATLVIWRVPAALPTDTAPRLPTTVF